VEQRNALLHIVIVGGGPTGVEVAGEIVDFVDTDMKRLYPDIWRDTRVTLVEGRDILGSFNIKLREYAARHLTRNGVKLTKVRARGAAQRLHLCQLVFCWNNLSFATRARNHLALDICERGAPLQGVVKEVKKNKLILKDGSVLDFGLCIWSTGVGPTPFIESLPFAKTNVGRLAVNSRMQVLIREGQVRNALMFVARGPATLQPEGLQHCSTASIDGCPMSSSVSVPKRAQHCPAGHHVAVRGHKRRHRRRRGRGHEEHCQDAPLRTHLRSWRLLRRRRGPAAGFGAGAARHAFLQHLQHTHGRMLAHATGCAQPLAVQQ
jgi:Pyridine nucleotide-disulphide oxidoreductase